MAKTPAPDAKPDTPKVDAAEAGTEAGTPAAAEDAAPTMFVGRSDEAVESELGRLIREARKAALDGKPTGWER